MTSCSDYNKFAGDWRLGEEGRRFEAINGFGMVKDKGGGRKRKKMEKKKTYNL